MQAGPAAERQARGRRRERAILAAVTGLLGEAGYEAMTMDAVAARAHASKTTIYRRWPGKADLVRAAVDAHVAGRVLSGSDTGSLRGDLLAVLRSVRSHLTPEFMAMMSGLVHEVIEAQVFRQMMTAADLDDAFARHVVDDIVLPLLAGSIAPPGPAR